MAKCPYCDFTRIAKSIDNDLWQKAMLDELDYMASQVSGHCQLVAGRSN